MATALRIIHTAAHGTQLRPEACDTVVGDVMRQVRDRVGGWTWTHQHWEIRGSRHHQPHTRRIDAAAAALRAVGIEVEVHINRIGCPPGTDQPLTVGDRPTSTSSRPRDLTTELAKLPPAPPFRRRANSHYGARYHKRTP
ncbi:hypothetical protein [Nocardia niwae]|uniref:hypothetical protein n=1 Tax=Nocardia niwae TaxID=626084 RepID=UPI0033E2663A